MKRGPLPVNAEIEHQANDLLKAVNTGAKVLDPFVHILTGPFQTPGQTYRRTASSVSFDLRLLRSVLMAEAA